MGAAQFDFGHVRLHQAGGGLGPHRCGLRKRYATLACFRAQRKERLGSVETGDASARLPHGGDPHRLAPLSHGDKNQVTLQRKPQID